MTFLAEIEPSFIFMILIWLFSSFFSKKGKNKGQSIPKENRLSNVGKLIEKLGGLRNMDLNQSQPVFSEYEAGDDLSEPELYFDEVKVEGGEYTQEEVKVESQLKKKSISTEIKLFGTPLQKAMVLKEILDKPRALRRFNF